MAAKVQRWVGGADLDNPDTPESCAELTKTPEVLRRRRRQNKGNPGDTFTTKCLLSPIIHLVTRSDTPGVGTLQHGTVPLRAI